MLLCFQGHLPSKVFFVIFNSRLYSIQSHLPTKVVFHPRLSAIQGHLPPKVIFYPRVSSIQDHFPSCLSSIQGGLSSKVAQLKIQLQSAMLKVEAMAVLGKKEEEEEPHKNLPPHKYLCTHPQTQTQTKTQTRVQKCNT